MDIKLNVGDEFYEVFEFYETVNKLTVIEIYNSKFGGEFYKCRKENNVIEDIQYFLFLPRLELGYYCLTYEEAVIKYNKKYIDSKILKLQKKIDKLEAKKIKI